MNLLHLQTLFFSPLLSALRTEQYPGALFEVAKEAYVVKEGQTTNL